MNLFNQENLPGFLLMDIVGILFTGFFIHSFSVKKVKDIGDKIAIVFLWIIEIIMFYFLFLPFIPALLPLFEPIAKIVLFGTFSLAGLGIMLYGFYGGIVKRQIYVKLPIPILFKWLPSVLFGILFSFVGWWLFIFTLYVSTTVTCAENHTYCNVRVYLENILNLTRLSL